MKHHHHRGRRGALTTDMICSLPIMETQASHHPVAMNGSPIGNVKSITSRASQWVPPCLAGWQISYGKSPKANIARDRSRKSDRKSCFPKRTEITGRLMIIYLAALFCCCAAALLPLLLLSLYWIRPSSPPWRTKCCSALRSEVQLVGSCSGTLELIEFADQTVLKGLINDGDLDLCALLV